MRLTQTLKKTFLELSFQSSYLYGSRAQHVEFVVSFAKWLSDGKMDIFQLCP